MYYPGIFLRGWYLSWATTAFFRIATWRLKAGIAGPEKASIAKHRPVNTFPRQRKHAPVSTIPGPSQGNSPLNTPLNNGGILGSGVFCAARPEAIWPGPTGQAGQLVMGRESWVRSRRSESPVKVLSCIVRRWYQATTNEDIEGSVIAVVICSVCRLVEML
jgi:hypothetical protein